MRYIVIFLTVFATGCFGQRSGKDSKSKIDTAKLFNPNNHPDHSGAKEMNMFKRSILLTHPELYAVLNDSEYKFEAAKKLNEFLNTNKDEIQKDLFYILIDSNTAFKRIVSTLDLLKENQYNSVFVKSSTGFYITQNNLPNGATLETIIPMLENASPLPVKAAGGVRTFDEATAMIQLGVKRIGTSGAKAISDGQIADSSY